MLNHFSPFHIVYDFRFENSRILFSGMTDQFPCIAFKTPVFFLC